MPGSGRVMEGAMQQAPHPARHSGPGRVLDKVWPRRGCMPGLSGRARGIFANPPPACRMYKFPDLYKMKTLSLSEFRAHASEMVDLVQQGETVRILRHGKPVAELVPVRAEPDAAPERLPHWKRPIEPVQLPPGQSLSQAVLAEREDAPW
jgi:prevent-host-death family protein